MPENLDEFIELCKEIEQTGIRAIQPALYYRDAARQFFTGFTYQAVLGGMDNEKWLSDYKKGGTVMKGHMEPAFAVMDRLADAGILRPEDFDMQPVKRSNMMYVEQNCAMILETQAAVIYAKDRAGDNAPELGLMPFFSSSNPDSDYFLSVPVYNMSAGKSLEEKGNEEKLAIVKEIFAFLSTAEGQKAVMGDNSTVISSVKGVGYKDNEFLKDAAATIEKGHVIPQPYFAGSANTEIDRVLREDLCLYAAGELGRELFMEHMDQKRDQILQNERDKNAAVIGTAEETFSILQTSCLLAEIFQEKTGAQIGLCVANSRESANNWKIYQGEIQYGIDESIDYYLDISFQHVEDRNHMQGKLVKANMTGENLQKALNETYATSNDFPDAYVTASGLQITFAPWAGDGNRYVSVKLADGTELDPNALYTVAFWNGAVNPVHIDSVEAEYDDVVSDLFRKWVEAHGGSIKPDNKDFILDWNITESR